MQPEEPPEPRKSKKRSSSKQAAPKSGKSKRRRGAESAEKPVRATNPTTEPTVSPGEFDTSANRSPQEEKASDDMVMGVEEGAATEAAKATGVTEVTEATDTTKAATNEGGEVGRQHSHELNDKPWLKFSSGVQATMHILSSYERARSGRAEASVLSRQRAQAWLVPRGESDQPGQGPQELLESLVDVLSKMSSTQFSNRDASDANAIRSWGMRAMSAYRRSAIGSLVNS